MAFPEYDWVSSYHTFAEGLIPYREKQSELVAAIRKAFDQAGIKQPTLDEDGTIQRMDPFTVFGLFNKTGMKDNKRIVIIQALMDALHIEGKAPDSFVGIPVLNPLNATYYPFSMKNDESLFGNLWDLFVKAIQYAEQQNAATKEELKRLIDFAIRTKYNGNSKVTMGLYWIAPETFINLDSRNEWYIYESGKIPEELVRTLPRIKGATLTGEKYFEILDGVKAFLPQTSFSNFVDLSYEAWRYSEEVNARNAAKKKGGITVNEDVAPGLADEDVQEKHYWIYSPGEYASKWEAYSQDGDMRIGWGELGDLRQYPTRESMRDKMKELYGEQYTYKMDSLACWQFSRELKPGDIVYAKQGRKKLVGRGVVTGEYEYDPAAEAEYSHLHKVDWTDKGEWEHPGSAIIKTLTDITPYTDQVAKLEAIFRSDADEDDYPTEIEAEYPPYTKENFLSEVFMDEKDFDTLAALLKKKKNVILQGAPGVGKTYTAKRLAYALMGEKNQERVMMVQFHQSYSYEDFIEGFRPDSEGKGFTIKKGSFYQFCKKATDDLEHDYFFIIDEINRGNMSRIFGELFMLVEADKRGNALQLLYSDEKFSVPKNVYLIGTMNTADRSLALLDYALRRRFAFYDMKPGFDTTGFRAYRESVNHPKFNKLITQVKALNEMIAADDTLGEGFCIGHSYFCNAEDVSEKGMSDIVEYELAPLLKEYWYDEKNKAEDAIYALREAIK